MTSVMQKWSERFPDFGTVIKRFPVTVLVMACVTLYYILIGWDSRNESINFGIIGLALSAYLAVMQTLWAEARGKKPNWILQIVMAVLITALFYLAIACALGAGAMTLMFGTLPIKSGQRRRLRR